MVDPCRHFGLSPPTHPLVHDGPMCPGKYQYTTYSPLRIHCDRSPGDVTCEKLPWLPLYLHFVHTCLLIACFAVYWHLLSILNIFYQQVNTNYIYNLMQDNEVTEFAMVWHTVSMSHSHSQRLRSFRSAPRIATSGLNRFSEHVQSIHFALSGITFDKI